MFLLLKVKVKLESESYILYANELLLPSFVFCFVLLFLSFFLSCNIACVSGCACFLAAALVVCVFLWLFCGWNEQCRMS